MTLRVCVAGATGWSGAPIAKAISESKDMTLVGAVSRTHAGEVLGSVIGAPNLDVVISGSVQEALRAQTDVLLDLTGPDVAKSNVLQAIEAGVHAVIGTSGLTHNDFEEIHAAAMRKNVGVLAAGNFSVSAILLEHFAVEAAKYFSSWEILDYASATKPDAPSGVSRELAFRVSETRQPDVARPIEKTIGPPESRGATFDGTQIHSIRLPGYTIALEIFFGDAQEKLILRHEAGTGAQPYVWGALLAIRNVIGRTGLTRGLDRILDSANSS